MSWPAAVSICEPVAPNPARRITRAAAIHGGDWVDTISRAGLAGYTWRSLWAAELETSWETGD
jgi:hypothetical protein